MMTGLLRRIRAMMDEAGARRGRPILFAVRTPDSPGYCKGLGLDVESWMREGLIDIWIVSGYFRLQEWKETVAVGRRFGVQVWASLDESRVTGGRDSSYNSRESYRARAMNAWSGGVDSIWLFNFFYLPGSSQFDLLREIGDPVRLAQLDKMYVPDARGRPDADRWLKGGERFFTRPETFSPAHPVALRPGRSIAVRLLVGDDLNAAVSRGLEPRVELEIETEGLKASEGLSVRFNGQEMKGGRLSGNSLAFALDPAAVRFGFNQIVISSGPEPPPETTLRDLRLWIRYRPSERQAPAPVDPRMAPGP